MITVPRYLRPFVSKKTTKIRKQKKCKKCGKFFQPK